MGNSVAAPIVGMPIKKSSVAEIIRLPFGIQNARFANAIVLDLRRIT